MAVRRRAWLVIASCAAWSVQCSNDPSSSAAPDASADAGADAGTLVVTTSAVLPEATTGVAYAAPLEAAGGTPPYKWSLAAGSVGPPGLTIVPSGTIVGTPGVPKSYAFVIAATDAAGRSAQLDARLDVVAPGNPVPSLNDIEPMGAVAGAPDTFVIFTGSGFAMTAIAQWDGAPLDSSVIASGHLEATIPASRLATAGTHAITVFNPAPGGGTSNAFTFTVTAGADAGPEDAAP